MRKFINICLYLFNLLTIEMSLCFSIYRMILIFTFAIALVIKYFYRHSLWCNIFGSNACFSKLVCVKFFLIEKEINLNFFLSLLL